jgi:hypothetical protein
MDTVATDLDTSWPVTVRRHVYETWGEQSCRNPDHWPEVFDRLMKDGTATPGGSGYRRGSLRPTFERVVAELAQVFADPVSLEATLARMRQRFKGQVAPITPGFVVWTFFPKLDQRHATKLATLLLGDMS